MCFVNKIVVQDSSIPTSVSRTYHSNVWLIELGQGLYENVCPSGRFKDCIIVDTIVVIRIIQVGVHHGVILSPAGLPLVVTSDQLDGIGRIDWAESLCVFTECTNKLPLEVCLCEILIVPVIGEVKLVSVAVAGCLAEGRHEGSQKGAQDPDRRGWY